MTRRRDLTSGPTDALVLDGDSRQSLVATRTLGREGLRIATAESSDLCDPRFGVPTFASRWSQREHILPSYHNDPIAYAQQLLDLVDEHPTRVLIPCMDGSIAALRPWRASFEQHGVALALASEAALDTANDKQSTLAVAAEHDIPRPRTVAINRLEDAESAFAEVGFPAVIKPTHSWVSNSGLATRVISRTVLNRSEGLDFLYELNDAGSSSAVLQQMVTGAREAVSVFYAHGTLWATFAQVAHRTTPVLGGVSVVRESIPMPADLLSAAETLVRVLDLEGYSEIEFRRDSRGRPCLMEINARLSGSLEVAVRSGVPFPALLWRWAMGEPLTPVPGYRTGIRMRYLKGDIKWLGENIESRGQRPECVPPRQAMAVFAKDFLHRQAYDYLDRGDLGPAVAALAGNVGQVRRRLSTDQPATPIGRPSPTGPRGSGAMPSTEVVVIGAGPNGLSVSAHLRHAGIEHRIFGQTMGAWRFNMPAGMMLKSEPYASDLSTPAAGYLARDYCAQANEVYHDRVIPLSREQFVDYGTWFAGQVVPDLEETEITSVSQAPTGGFQVRTADGEDIRAARVVVATGIIPFAYVPPELSSLPADLVSHTSQHPDLAPFRGKEVLVVGGGSSALETSALLLELGATVKLVMRGDAASWPPPNPEKYPTRLEQLRRPVARLCEGWPCWGYDRLPDVFRLLPSKTRLEHALGFLGPQGAWWLRERVEGKVPMLLDHQVLGAEPVGDRVQLHLRGPEGVRTESADHVVAGTGFRFDMSRLGYLAPSLRADLELMGGAPVLNHSLESNVPGLFFTGALAAPSMGPLMRFVAGTHFIGPRLVHGLSAKKRRRSRPKSNPNWQSIQPSNGNGTAPGGLEKEALSIETNEHIA